MSQLLLSIWIISLGLFMQTCSTQKNISSNEDASVEVSTDDKKEDQNKSTYPITEYTEANNLGNWNQAVFAGGCFWCTEAAFERINGVVDVLSGYSGGHKDYPGYGEVGKGTTGHAEAIYIYYDPEVIDYGTLLDVFFVAHDPTTLNRQGPDVGEEYRSAIYFMNETEQAIIDQKIKELNASDKLDGKIVTEVAAYKQFWVGEDYHQNYYELHPNQSYVASVSRPKVNKVVKAFPDLVKAKYRKD